MESVLIEKLVPLGTGGIFLLVLFLSRKEILQVLLAPRGDKTTDRRLAQMNGLFERNINQVDEVKGVIGEIKGILSRSESLLSQIKDEAIRDEAIRGRR